VLSPVALDACVVNTKLDSARGVREGTDKLILHQPCTMQYLYVLHHCMIYWSGGAHMNNMADMFGWSLIELTK
jgi:hypothetical protein